MRNSLRAAVALGLVLPAVAQAQSVVLDGATPVQTFAELASSGTANTTLPNGWYIAESGTNANTTYRADTGASNTGDTYSYGSAALPADRALGGLRSSALVPTIGAQLTNSTGAALTQITLAYSGEQWRIGTAARPDRLDFQFSVDATSLTTGTWVDVDALDFAVPGGAASGAIDGNANSTAISGAISGINVANGASLWIRWNDADATSADDGLAIDDVQFTTGPVVDVAPTVSSTTPANSATNVARAANLSVAFSEPVTAGASWFSLTCGTSGARALADFAVTGGPSSYALNPNADFAYGETCTGTIRASAITDQDGTPDPPAADYVFAFTVEAEPVDVAPTVASITPANAASNIPASTTITVVFSEPVTTSAAAFALSCNSAAQAFAFSGSGTTYTLDPTTNIEPLVTCTVTITASGVADLDGTPNTLSANFVSTFTTSAGQGDYYDTVDASSCSALRTTLHAAIDDHQFYPYTATATDTWDILNQADQDPLNSANVLDVYKNESYQKITGGTGVYNREHTWPNSYGFNDRTGDEAYTDTHMLYVSNSSYNSTRNNLPFDNCPPSAGCGVLPTSAYNGRGGGPTTYPGNHNWYKTGAEETFEVWNGRKGDVARAILYMDIRYEGGVNALSNRPEPDLIVTDNRALIQGTASGVFQTVGYMGMKTTLIQWHLADPPDTQEGLRNDLVQSYQGNRNPFIDHPEWVDCLYNCNCAVVLPDAVFKDSFE